MSKQKTVSETEIAKRQEKSGKLVLQGGGPSAKEIKAGLDKSYGSVVGRIIIEKSEQQGESYQQIADFLNEQGYTLPRGQFLPQHIARYLSVTKALEQ